MVVWLIVVSILNALSAVLMGLRARNDFARQGRLSLWSGPGSTCTVTQQLYSRLLGWIVVRSTKQERLVWHLVLSSRVSEGGSLWQDAANTRVVPGAMNS